MRELYQTLIPVRITSTDERGEVHVLRCPKCRRESGLTAYGYRGGTARMLCPCGADFAPPPPHDAAWIMQRSSDPANRTVTNVSVGKGPSLRHFR